MRNRLKEEKGYTIIIALLLIVLFLGAAAVFMQSSLSHAKQEQTVDRNNLAVVAAEMGSERFTKQTQVHLNKTYSDLLRKANTEKDIIVTAGKAYKTTTNYTDCPNVRSPQELMDCRFNLLEKDLAADLQKSIQTYLAGLNKNSVKVDTDVAYSLVRFELESTVTPDQEVNLLLEVRGEKGDTGSKLLKSDLTFYNPFILDRNKSTDIEIIVDTELKTVSNFFPQVSEKQLPKCPEFPYKHMTSCEYHGELKSTYLADVSSRGITEDFYIRTRDLGINSQLNGLNTYKVPLYLIGKAISSASNLNGAKNLHLFSQSVLKFQNFNNAENNIIVAESLEIQNNNNGINNTIVLTGNVSKPTFPVNTFNIGSGSKLCLNADALNIINSNLSIQGTGLIYLYSENADTTKSTSNIIHIKNADDFMRACGVTISYVPDDPIKYQVPGLTALEGMDMDWEVDYTP